MMLRLNINSSLIAPDNSPNAVLASANLDQRYRPVGGLLLSVLTHGLIFTVLLFVPFSTGVSERQRLMQKAVIVDVKDLAQVLYLPALAPATSPAPQPEHAPAAAAEASRPAQRSKGFSYPGPQEIVSDFKEPTNQIQTVLQPALVDPDILKPPLLLPNIVKISNAGPAPQVRPPDPVTRKPAAELLTQAVEPAQMRRIPTPISQLPRTTDTASLELPPAYVEPPKPEPPKPVEPPKPPEPPKPTEVAKTNVEPKVETKVAETPKAEPAKSNAPTPTSGPDSTNLLALTPMPAPPQPSITVPPGEARGRFAISPQPNPSPAETQPGGRTVVNLPASNPTNPSGNGTSSGNGTAAATAGAGNGTSAGNGTRGRDANSSGNAGITISVPPAPARSAAGGPFAGITIVGGSGNNSGVAKSTPDAPLQTSYGITVLSAGNSGGALPNYGVFTNEQVYTAFLDMRRNPTDQSPSWPVEYALLPPDPGQSGIKVEGGSQGVVLPFPATKESPVLPIEAVRRYPRRMVVVFAVINIFGKLEQIAVKDSPDSALNVPVLMALDKWVFRPAQRDGVTVPAKVLFGIPVWAATN